MMRYIVVVLVLVIQTVIAQNNNNNNNNIREGTTCELSTNEKGICIRLSLCSSARELIKQRKIPENCGFINGITITCCPKGPRKLLRLADKKCKYVELSRFGFIADTDSLSSPANVHLTLNEENNNYPIRIKIPTATEQNVIKKDFSRFPLEAEVDNKFKTKNEETNVIPKDFSRFPLDEKEEDTAIKFEDEEEKTTNIFPIVFSRFPSEDEDTNIKFEEDEKEKPTNIFPFTFSSRFGFNENNYKHVNKQNNQKIRARQNEFNIPMDFSRFSYSPTTGILTQRRRFGSHNNLIHNEADFLPKLNLSSKDISDLIIRETPNYVLGGQDAKKREFPHMAALGYEFNKKIYWLCGGSLISDQYVLTAAHCLNSLDYGPLKWIRLGEINREPVFLQVEHQDFQVEKAIPYPLYRPSSTYHDIALVKLDRKAAINNLVNTACLFTEEKIPPTLELWATGWGLTAEGGNQSEILQKVELNVFSEEECNKAYKAKNQLKYGILHKQQICAGGRVNQKDTCKGDSGGPLQIKMNADDGDIYYIVGVTSFGKQCGNKNVPGIYTRISFYISWIENIIWPDEQ